MQNNPPRSSARPPIACSPPPSTDRNATRARRYQCITGLSESAFSCRQSGTDGPLSSATLSPCCLGAAIWLGLIWLFSEKEKATPPPTQEKTSPVTPARAETPSQKTVAPQPKAASRRVTREDVAGALSYGSHPVPRLEAVAALQSLGFGKTAAYKGLSPDGRFGELLEHTPDGLIEWKG